MMEAINYDRKVASKQEAKDALRSLRQAESFLLGITRFDAEVQITRAEFDAAVSELNVLRREGNAWRALALALVQDRPVPVSVFGPWASKSTIRKWTQKVQNPLPTMVLNNKIVCTPANFFAALELHGPAA